MMRRKDKKKREKENDEEKRWVQITAMFDPMLAVSTKSKHESIKMYVPFHRQTWVELVSQCHCQMPLARPHSVLLLASRCTLAKNNFKQEHLNIWAVGFDMPWLDWHWHIYCPRYNLKRMPRWSLKPTCYSGECYSIVTEISVFPTQWLSFVLDSEYFAQFWITANHEIHFTWD